MRLKVTQELDDEGVAFGVPVVTNLETGERIEGIRAVTFYATEGEFPEIEMQLAGAIHEIDVVGFRTDEHAATEDHA